MNAQKKIEIVDYSPEWPAIFEKEKSIILKALGENCVAVHHVGSTSVPNLIAKPKIDIIAVAKDRKRAIVDLEKIEYLYKGEWNIPLQCGFAKRIGTHVNLHMFFEKDHPEIELNLAFRDYLRSHEDIKIAYENLKKEILNNEENATKQVKVGALWFPLYTIRKRAFIDNILRKIGFNRLRVIKCLTETERNVAKQFSEIHFGNLGVKDRLVIDFEDENYEHFILYKGVDICGYANLQISQVPNIILIEVQNHKDESFFRNVIQKWIDVHYA